MRAGGNERVMQNLAVFKKGAEAATSVTQLRDQFSGSIKQMGYHGFDAYVLRAGTLHNVLQDGNLYVCDYGLEPLTDYLADGFLHLDPSLRQVAQGGLPFNYIKCLQNAPSSSSVKWQLRLLRLNNVHHAWAFPLSSVDSVRGMTVYMRGKGKAVEKRFEETCDELHLMCAFFMDRFIKLSAESAACAPAGSETSHGPLDLAQVTARETDCLAWASRGKTNWEIGEILSVSENTVRYHLKNVFRKLGAKSRSEAVAQAARGGLIDL